MAASKGDVDSLSPRLRPVYEAIRELFAGATQHEVRTRHRVGVLIAGVKTSREKYGARAVEQLAGALATNVHTLYRCAAVAECWTPSGLDAISHRRTPRGQPLSWSHLVLLAGIPSPRRRTELLDRALEQGLTVRQLAVLVESSSAGERAGLFVLRRVVTASERWSQRMEGVHDELLAELEAASSEAEVPALLLDQAIAAQEHVQWAARRQLALLRAQRRRLDPVAPTHLGHLRHSESTSRITESSS
jgi:hypothetical protein